ncbi:MAG: hypothetical protein CMH54_04735 [Myxococcales bacterium]|nr:hypothetical protein [Myxococcales bacterium]
MAVLLCLFLGAQQDAYAQSPSPATESVDESEDESLDDLDDEDLDDEDLDDEDLDDELEDDDFDDELEDESVEKKADAPEEPAKPAPPKASPETPAPAPSPEPASPSASPEPSSPTPATPTPTPTAPASPAPVPASPADAPVAPTPAPAASTPAPAASTPAPAAPAPTPSNPATTGTDDGRPNFRLKALQNRVTSLKQEVFRTKTRLMLIKERLLNNVIAEAKLMLMHKNALSGAFLIDEIIYFLDDNKIYYGDRKTGNLKSSKSFTIYDGNTVPGYHVLTIDCLIRGNSTLFPYVGDFQFRLRSQYTFFAARGRITKLRAKLYEKGGLLVDYRDRPTLKYDLKQYPYTRENMNKLSTKKK